MKIFIDGGSRGNPGESALGVVVFDDEGKEVERFGKRIGNETNNYAEYAALIEALRYVADRFEANPQTPRSKGISVFSTNRSAGNPGEVTVYSDSELLVHQLSGRYKVRSENLQPLFRKAEKYLREMRFVHVEHIGRERNEIADWIVNRVLDGKPYRPADRSREGKPSEESPGS
jgi:ribonuclease HI